MLLTLAVVPVIILLIFTYIKDKYEKEPLILLFLGVFYGLFLVVPVLCVDVRLMNTKLNLLYPEIFQAFIMSAGNEEMLKFIFLFFLIYRNKNFNEPLDSIIYSIFISLGFALGENIVYVYNLEIGGFQTAFLRGITSIPAHMFFAISMGYYFARWRYLKDGNTNLLFSFAIPWMLHGLYNFLLLTEIKYFAIIFPIYFLIIGIVSVFMFKKHLDISPFKFLKKK